jgi:hypothetical protein
MEHVPTGDGLTRKLATRLNEVAEHRASRWLEELDRVTRVPAKWRLIKRMDEVTEDLTSKWLRELNGRRCWLDYRKAYGDFCYGVGFGEFADCEWCPNHDQCKAEKEAEWPQRES